MGRSIATQHPQTSAVTDVAELEAQPRWPGPAAPGRGPSEPPPVRSRSHVQEPRGGSQDRLHGIWGEQSEPVSQLLTPKGLLWLCVKARLARDLGGHPIWPRPRPVMALISCRGSGRPHGSLPGLPPLLPRGAAPARRCPEVRRRPGGARGCAPRADCGSCGPALHPRTLRRPRPGLWAAGWCHRRARRRHVAVAEVA